MIRITIIILRQALYLIYLCPCLGLSLFMLYLWDLFFIFSIIFIVIDHITTLRQTHLFFLHFLEYILLFLDNEVDEESKRCSNSKSSISGCCLAFGWFFAFFSLALFIRVLLIKNHVFYMKYKVCLQHFVHDCCNNYAGMFFIMTRISAAKLSL